MSSFLFVCTGNICRSPLAEIAMRNEAEQRNLLLDIDSAGTGSWHTGDPPDPRARKTAIRHGLNVDQLRARQVTLDDFQRFDHIIAMDRSHLSFLKKMKPLESKAKLCLMLDFLPHSGRKDVVDPYYGPDAGFETTWQDVSAACAKMAEQMLDDIQD
ncbi:low molecular weight protein-tyrosine-phosphatase [Gluconobacter wancherniae]|uniref:low molecular weight protein-tyrosine-phosphatase n=1 Tax=Gluconobacter wancherniae TaxID=1307955 RepID=UPI001B8D3D93|nr:low molecular weight protein-tyrosine-phosphatase [Gluconobacter wancherniae]MBS1094416.1 low molecular weight phosphotyrosine protein phosphatase [Gluconobacter wancherniae]MBS1094495.1 low molecular weight phosphotyrosine protein phosphatase [Gluconobacter wancherniae]